MSEDIGPGDWVECIDISPTQMGSPWSLSLGAIYQVKKVGIGHLTKSPLLWLNTVEESIEGGYQHWRFRPLRRSKEIRNLIKSLTKTKELV